MNPSNIRNDILRTNLLIVGSFLFYYIYQVIYWVPDDIVHGLREWAYTDWLIDYSAGFVRRGLSGEIIDALRIILPPKVSIGIISWSVFTFVVFGYIRLIVRSIEDLSPYVLVAILFLPSLLPFYLHDHLAFGRKEVLGFLPLFLHLYGLESLGNYPRLRGYIKVLIPITLILLPIQMLIHENTLLLFVPVHAAISFSYMRFFLKNDLKKLFTYLIVLYLPVLIIFAIVMYFQPNFEVALAICQKWELVKALRANSCLVQNKSNVFALPGAFGALSWSFSQASSLPLSFTRQVIFFWILLIGVMSFVVIINGRITSGFIIKKHFPQFTLDTINKYKAIASYKYFLFPLFASIPIYIIGWDWGRWFSVTCLNYVIVILSGEMARVDGKLIEQSQEKLNKPTQNYIPKHNSLFRYLLGVFSLLSIIFFVRVPHCCNEGFNMLANPLISLLQKALDVFF